MPLAQRNWENLAIHIRRAIGSTRGSAIALNGSATALSNPMEFATFDMAIAAATMRMLHPMHRISPQIGEQPHSMHQTKVHFRSRVE